MKKPLDKFLVALFFVAAIAQPLSGMESPVIATHGAQEEEVFDKRGMPITLEWYKMTDPGLNQGLKEQLATVAVEAFADNELTFLLDSTLHVKEEYAEAVKTVPQETRERIMALANLDRKTRIECLRPRYLQRIAELSSDLTKTKFVVIAREKNESGTILGLVVFTQKSTDSVELDPLAVIPSAQGRGLSQNLVFSIFTVPSLCKLMPEIKHVHLDTQIWNTRARHVYEKLGFTECGRPGFLVEFHYEDHLQ